MTCLILLVKTRNDEIVDVNWYVVEKGMIFYYFFVFVNDLGGTSYAD